MTDLRQRAPRVHDAAHLAFVRTRPCCIRGCNRQAEAAHLRMACPARGKPPTGMQEKPDDKWVTPLCAYHHRTGADSQHSQNEADFWRFRGLDPFQIALDLWKQSGGEERAAQPKPPKKPRKIRPRSAPERRRKIQASRPLKSNPVIPSRSFQKPDAQNHSFWRITQ